MQKNTGQSDFAENRKNGGGGGGGGGGGRAPFENVNELGPSIHSKHYERVTSYMQLLLMFCLRMQSSICFFFHLVFTTVMF